MKNNKRIITTILLISMLLVLGARQYKINALTRELNTTNKTITAVKEEQQELNNIVFTYKADKDTQLKNYWIEKGDTLTVYKDNSYEIVDQNGIIVNQE